MTEEKKIKEEPESISEDVATPTCAQQRTPLSIALLLIVLSAIAGAVLGYQLIWKMPSGKVASLAITDRLDRLEQRVSLIEQKIGKVTARTEQPATPLKAEDDVSAVKGDLIDLASALKAFETKLNESSQRTESVKTEAREGLATVLAFVQMQYAARTGLPFEGERLVLANLINQDEEKLLELLSLLEPYALDGVPMMEVLHKEWRALEPEIQAAIRKSGAKTWQDRIIVALESLISIRSLSQHQGKTLSFAEIDKDLSAHRIESALKKVSELSPEVQKITQKWREHAEARARTEKFLGEVSARLIQAEQLKHKKEPAAPEPTAKNGPAK